jgi:hypothetical protein
VNEGGFNFFEAIGFLADIFALVDANVTLSQQAKSPLTARVPAASAHAVVIQKRFPALKACSIRVPVKDHAVLGRFSFGR